MRQLARQYVLEQEKTGRFTTTTARRQLDVLYGFADSYGIRPPEQMTYRAIERWLSDHPNWKQSTRRMRWSTVKGFCQWLHKRRVIPADPFLHAKPPRGARPRPAPLTADDVAALYAVLPDSRATAIVALLYELGLRCNAVAHLRAEDVDRVAGTISVYGKGGHHYQVPLTPEVDRAINRYLEEHPAGVGPLIRSYVRPNQPLSADTIGDLVRTWMIQAGVKKSPGDRRSAHTLRATALTEVARATNDPYIVMSLAGHANIATSAWYVPRVGTKAVAAALDKRAMERAVLRVQP